jgi:uncharacterized protein
MFNPELLDLLGCPRCKGPLTHAAEIEALICRHCNLQYPIRGGVPILRLEEAQPLSPSGTSPQSG